MRQNESCARQCADGRLDSVEKVGTKHGTTGGSG
jgi:hypothetical protein